MKRNIIYNTGIDLTNYLNFNSRKRIIKQRINGKINYMINTIVNNLLPFAFGIILGAFLGYEIIVRA